MKTDEEIIFVADDGSKHKTLEECCVRSVEVLLFKLADLDKTDHRLAAGLRRLALNWPELNARLVLINRESLGMKHQLEQMEVEM